jgi:two-component system nitrate/nitrite response regulator NarL
MSTTTRLSAPRRAPRTVAPPSWFSVVLAEDHPIYREGLARAIDANPRLRLVGDAANGHEAVELAMWLRPDLALLDLRMPGLDGLAACSRIVAASRTRVVMLSAFAVPSLEEAAISAGARGFLSKEATRREVLRALVTVGEGGTAYSGAP